MNGLILLAQGTRIQSIDMDLGVFKFQAGLSSALNQTIGAIVLLVLIAIGGFVTAYFFRQRRLMRELSEQREEARLRLILSDLNLGQNDLALLATIAGGDQPTDLMPLMETRGAFEEGLEEFRRNNPRAPELKRINRLRQRLEFGFKNIRNPFNDTRMLAPGIRVRCTIRLANREVNFLTSIVGINEDLFIIRPPQSKGKPVSMGTVGELRFRVSRENNGEYEFGANVIGQQPEGLRAVMVAHTKNISRMLFRNAERIEMDVPAEFFVIRQELAHDRTPASLKVMDSQYKIPGHIRDLSMGGALVVSEGQQGQLHDGDMIVFPLPAANIREELVSQVVGIFPLDEGGIQFHLQFQGMKELNRLKLARFLTTLKERGITTGDKLDEPATPAAS